MRRIEFDGRTAIVTGAASGIGKAIAEALGHRGARVLLNDLRAADDTAAAIRDAGGETLIDVTPVGDFSGAAHIVKHALDHWGRLDILVNCAGTSAPGAFADIAEADIRRVIDVNLIGPYALTQAVWPAMQRQRYGRILNIASNAVLGMGRSAAYAAAKGGLIALAKDNAREGAAYNIKANVMLPVASTTMTDRIPPGAFRDWIDSGFPPSRLGAPAAFLLSEGAPVSGEIFSCGGGRMARTAYVNTAGYIDVNATPEAIAAQFDTVMRTDTAVLVENHAQELNRYTALHPWPVPGGMPGVTS